MERSERHREGPSGPIRAERYPTVKLDLKHKKTIFALWASQTWRTAQSNHNHSRFTYNNTAHRHNTSVKCGHLILKGDPFKILELPFFFAPSRQRHKSETVKNTSHKNCQNLAYTTSTSWVNNVAYVVFTAYCFESPDQNNHLYMANISKLYTVPPLSLAPWCSRLWQYQNTSLTSNSSHMDTCIRALGIKSHKGSG